MNSESVAMEIDESQNYATNNLVKSKSFWTGIGSNDVPNKFLYILYNDNWL